MLDNNDALRKNSLRNKSLTKLLVLVCFLFISSTGWSLSELGSEPPKRLLIYWDTSFSMDERSLDLEFDLLSRYFEGIGDVNVDFVTFDHELGKASSHIVKMGQWESLRQEISGLQYDGIALFNQLELEGEQEPVLIFSDGIPVLDELKLPVDKSVYLISSVPQQIDSGSLSKHVNYLNLHMQGVSRILQRLGIEQAASTKETAAANSSQSGEAIDETGPLLIEGIVYDRGSPLKDVTISVKGEDRGAISGSDGRFAIEIDRNDVLLIGYLGMEQQEHRVSGDEFLEIYLDSKNNILKDVVLKARMDSATTTATAFGEVNQDRIGYAVQTLEEKEFEGQRNISDATRGKIISYNYAQNDDLSQIQLRQVQTFAFGTKNPLIVVDDIPLGVNNSATGTVTFSTWHIDPSNIEKITVLRGLSSTNKFGTLGRGGAILIYTKTRAGADVKNGETNSAMVKGNIYKENVTSIQSKPTQDYLNELKKASSAAEAYTLYTDQRNSYLNDFQYFVNVSESMVRWGNPHVSRRIQLNALEMNPSSVEHLRATAMLLQDKKDFLLSEKIYKRILTLRPNEAQSYRDLALIYAENQKYKEALETYKKIKDGEYSEVSFEGLKKTLNSEMKRLLLLHKAQLNTYGLSSHYFVPLNYDVRVVVDWNDRDAEFELQFVDPQKKFFVWSHSRVNNASRLEQERTQGFNTEEFLLIDAQSGKWQINIESRNQNSSKPLALRYTVYRNYAQPNESRESKTIFLNEVEGKYLLGIIKI